MRLSFKPYVTCLPTRNCERSDVSKQRGKTSRVAKRQLVVLRVWNVNEYTHVLYKCVVIPHLHVATNSLIHHELSSPNVQGHTELLKHNS